MKTIKLFLFLFVFAGSGWNLHAQITEIGLASFYADKFDGRVTASGEIFDQSKYTAAHRNLPFGTRVKVTNLENRKVVSVTINDRGPFVKDRVIDLSKAAASDLGFIGAGVVKVKVEVEKMNFSSATVKTESVQDKPKTGSESIKSSLPLKESIPEQATIASEAIEYYTLKSEGISPSGFGVQVASYQEAANLMKLCDELRKKTHKDIIVQVGNSNGNKLYRVIIGTFETRELASGFIEKHKADFPGSFVLGF